MIGFDSKLPEFLPLWAKANGADLISDDGRTAQLDDPEVVEALEFAVGIYDDQGGFSKVKAFRDSADFFGEGNQFATDSLGAMPMEQWYVNVLNDVSPDAPDGLRHGPRPREGEPLAFASGSAWAIPKGSKNPEAACRFAADDDRDRQLGQGRRGAGRRCARRRAASSPASSPATWRPTSRSRRWSSPAATRRGTPRSRRPTRPTSTRSRCRPTPPARSSRPPGRTR